MASAESLIGDLPPRAILEQDYTSVIPTHHHVDERGDDVTVRSAFHYAEVLLEPGQRFQLPEIARRNDLLTEEALDAILNSIHLKIQGQVGEAARLSNVLNTQGEGRRELRSALKKISLTQKNIEELVVMEVHDYLISLSSISAQL